MMKAIFFDLNGAHVGTGRVLAKPPEPDAGSAAPVRPLADGGWLAATRPQGISLILAGLAKP
jgi:hypothetical protein